MLDLGLRLMTSIVLSGAEVVVESGRAVAGDDAFEIRPHQFRRLLLTFEESIQGQIIDILGEDEEERVETLVRLLRGTSEAEMTELIGSLQVALQQLADEDGFSDRSSRRGRRGGRRPPGRRRAVR